MQQSGRPQLGVLGDLLQNRLIAFNHVHMLQQAVTKIRTDTTVTRYSEIVLY